MNMRTLPLRNLARRPGRTAALLLLSYVLYLRHYKLDEPEYDRICAELKERRAYKKSV